jgi:hypothetical protein
MGAAVARGLTWLEDASRLSACCRIRSLVTPGYEVASVGLIRLTGQTAVGSKQVSLRASSWSERSKSARLGRHTHCGRLVYCIMIRRHVSRLSHSSNGT